MNDMYESMDWERRNDLGSVSWEDYLLYILEVDEDDVNKDAISNIADVFRGVES